MWNLEKMALMNPFEGSNRDTNIESRLVDIAGEREGGTY